MTRPLSSGSGHEMGRPRRDDERAHDHRPLHDRASELSAAFHGSELHLLRRTEVRISTHPDRNHNLRVGAAPRGFGKKQ